MQFFSKKTAGFEAETTLLSSSGRKTEQRIWIMQFTILSVLLHKMFNVNDTTGILNTQRDMKDHAIIYELFGTDTYFQF